MTDSSKDEPVVESATRARQGVTGHNVRYVLVFGLAGAILVMLSVYVLLVLR